MMTKHLTYRWMPARFADGVPEWFGKSLFEGDLERLVPHVEAAVRRGPTGSLAEAATAGDAASTTRTPLLPRRAR